MNRDSTIYVAGYKGLVGSALKRRLEARGYTRLIATDREDFDLRRQADVESFFAKTKPEYVFLAAAKVGGIWANQSAPAEFIHTNLAIEVNVVDAAYRFGARKLLFLGSSCIYPRLAPQPMREECLLTSALEPTNEAYAIAKIAGIKLCRPTTSSTARNFIAVMPTNLYGPNDNYHPRDSHVLPALIRRFHEAKAEGTPFVEAWGTGTPRREFMYSEDMADACIFLMEKYDSSDIGEIINIGTGSDITIRELTERVAETVGFRGEIRWDAGKPDGTPRKLLDVSRLHALGWRHAIFLEEGLKRTYADFLAGGARL